MRGNLKIVPRDANLEYVLSEREVAINALLYEEQERYIQGSVLQFRASKEVSSETELLQEGRWQDFPGVQRQNSIFAQSVFPKLKWEERRGDAVYIGTQPQSPAQNGEIIRCLPENHFSGMGDICFFIRAQENGEQGILITNGFSNVFYVRARVRQVFVTFVIFVLWRLREQEWRIDGWELSEHEDGAWQRGHQILYPRLLG